MIAGISLDESIAAFGRKLGIECGDPPLIRIDGNCFISDTCIVKLHFDWISKTHWTVWHEGRYYDPSRVLAEQLANMGRYPDGVRATSYLPIYL